MRATYHLLLSTLLCCAHGASIQLPSVRTLEGQVEYLQRFGYLRGNDMLSMSSDTRLGSQFRSALERFQRMVHIPVTGVMDSATTRMMNAPRCGVPDDIEDENESGRRSKRYVLSDSKWSFHSLRYRILSTSRDFNVTTQFKVIENAFQMWSAVTPLRFSRSRWYQKPDINIEFATMNHGDGYHNRFDGPGGTLAHARFPPSGDIHFDDDELWTAYGSGNGVDFLQVAVHEIGHALGLGHSEVYDSIMFPLYKPDMSRVQLHSDDIRGIQRLYRARTRS